MYPKILIVEDEEDIAESLRYNLERNNFRVEIALSGEKGLRLASDQDHPPALVLLDIMLPTAGGTPERGGFKLLETISQDPEFEDIKVIMCTNTSTSKDEDRAKMLGASIYLVKSNNSPDDVLARVKEVLGST